MCNYQVISYIGSDPVVVQSYKLFAWTYKAYRNRVESGIYDAVQIWLLDGKKRDELVFNWAKKQIREGR